MNAPVIPTLTDEQRRLLLEVQFAHATAGSEALMIHLGKAYLNQIDRQHHTVEAIPYSDKNYEQLLDMLEERQKAIPDERLCDGLAQSMLNPQALLPAPVPEEVAEHPLAQAIGIAPKRRGRPRKTQP